MSSNVIGSKYGIGNYKRGIDSNHQHIVCIFQIVRRSLWQRRLLQVLQQHMSFCWKQPYFRRPLKYHLFKCIYDESLKCEIFLYHLDEVQIRHSDFKTSNKMVKLVTVNTLLDDMCTSTTATVSLFLSLSPLRTKLSLQKSTVKTGLINQHKSWNLGLQVFTYSQDYVNVSKYGP